MFTTIFEKLSNTEADRAKIKAIGSGKHKKAHKKNKLKGGLADNIPDKAFSKKEVKRGMKVEREHTKDKESQKEIAEDHLAEDPSYYEKLEKMEKKGFASGFGKIAKVLTTKGRKQIKEENFALPGGRYPIHDAAHGKNALSRVAQFGTPEEQAKVRAAVHKKFPGIGKN